MTRVPSNSDRTWKAVSIGVWFGRFLSAIAVLALAADAVAKLAVPDLMIANSPPLGLPANAGFYRLLGAMLAISTALYAWPRTALLGAILLTGYLGGAVLAHLRVGSPLASHTMISVYLGIVVWGGLWLRDKRVRALLSKVGGGCLFRTISF